MKFKKGILQFTVVGVVAAGLVLVMLQNRQTKPQSQDQRTAGISAETLHTDCEAKPEAGDKFDCYQTAFDQDIKSNGARHTLELLDQLQHLGGYSLQNCHPLAHKIGNISLHVYGSVLAGSPQYIPVCASGYYHGLLEEYLATAKDYETGLKTACGDYSKANYFNWFQCTHGVGHGIMQYRADDVLQSVKDCDLLDPVAQAREICYGGVFMENITTDEKTGHKSKFIKESDPIYPCDIVATKYKSACYFLSSSMILRLNGYDFPDAFKACETKAEADYRWLCYQSLGRDVSGSTIRNNQKVKDLCLLGNEQGRQECFFGAVRDYINDRGQFDMAISLCKFIPGTYQGKCYAAIFLDLGLYKKGQDYLNTCALIPESYKGTCEAQVKYD